MSGTWSFRRYRFPDDVGWLGWIEVLGECVAHVDLSRRIFFASETGCDGSNLSDDDNDPADWWKQA